MKGVYLAIFHLRKDEEIEIGALGKKKFSEGKYVYVGSARTNVGKRLKRHFTTVENLHWHIDYFSSEAEPLDYFILPEKSEFECKMAEILKDFCSEIGEFGSSDCKCDSHLFRIPENFSQSKKNV